MSAITAISSQRPYFQGSSANGRIYPINRGNEGGLCALVRRIVDFVKECWRAFVGGFRSGQERRIAIVQERVPPPSGNFNTQTYHPVNDPQPFLETVANALDGREHFAQWPLLNLEDRVGRTGYIDFLQPQDLRHPIMRLDDIDGRQGVAFKILSRATNNEFVVTIHQRYHNDNRLWVHAGNAGNGVFDGLDIEVGERHLEVLQQIIAGNNNQYTINNN